MGKTPLILILALIIVAFVIAPVISGMRNTGASRPVFGTYGDQKIEYTPNSYFYNQVGQLTESNRDYLNSADNGDTIRYYIWSQAFQSTLLNVAKQFQLKESGFFYSQRGINRIIINSGVYSDEMGNFDEKLYAETSTDTKEMIKQDILNNVLQSKYDNDRVGGLHRSQAQIDSLLSISDEEKMFNYITIKSEDYPQSSVVAFGKANSDLFETFPISRITVESESDAEKLIKDLDSGVQTFEEAAMALSSDLSAKDGGAMGDVMKYNLIDELGEEKASAVLALAPGAHSTSPVETDYGWHIYSVTGESTTPDFTDETLIASVENYIKWNERALIDDWMLAQAKEVTSKINEANDFTSAALAAGQAVKSTDFFAFNWGSSPLLGSSISDNEIQGASQSDDFFTQAFSLTEAGSVSEPIILGESVVLLELVDQRASQSLLSSEDIIPRVQNYHLSLINYMISESPLFENTFSEAYYQIFTPEA